MIRDRTFQVLAAVQLVVFATACIQGWNQPATPIQAPPFEGVAGKAIEIFAHNAGATLVIVVGSVCTAGVFGVLMHGVNGYMAGALMRSTVEHELQPWLWLFAPGEVLAFATAGAAAAAVTIAAFRGRSTARAGLRVVALSLAGMAPSAVLESLLIKLDWGL